MVYSNVYCRCNIRANRDRGPNLATAAAAVAVDVRVFGDGIYMWADKMNCALVACMDPNSRMMMGVVVANVVVVMVPMLMVDVVHHIHCPAEKSQMAANVVDHHGWIFPNRWADRWVSQHQIDRSFVVDKRLAVMGTHRSDQNRMIARTPMKWVVYYTLVDSRNSCDICLWQFVHMVMNAIGLYEVHNGTHVLICRTEK